MTSKPASLAVTSGEGEASIRIKLQDHSGHKLIREKSMQLAIEAAVLDIAISHCQVDKQDIGLFLSFKRTLDVLREQNGLAHGLPPVLKSI